MTPFRVYCHTSKLTGITAKPTRTQAEVVKTILISTVKATARLDTVNAQLFAIEVIGPLSKASNGR